jgi:hypothetical protein
MAAFMERRFVWLEMFFIIEVSRKPPEMTNFAAVYGYNIEDFIMQNASFVTYGPLEFVLR